MKKTLFTLVAAIACCGTAVSADAPNPSSDALVLELGDVSLTMTEVTMGTTGKNSTQAAGITTNGKLVWDSSVAQSMSAFSLVFRLDQLDGTGNIFTAKMNNNSLVGPSLALNNGKLVFTKDGSGTLLTNESLTATDAVAATTGHVYLWSYVFGTNTEYLKDLTTGDTHVVTLNNDGFQEANKALVSNSATVWTNSNKNHVTVLGVADISSAIAGMDANHVKDTLNGAKLIPEPATATLSLLALAGLAACRRRK